MERMDTREDDDFRARSEAFISWLEQNGATISDKIELADLRQQGAGRGVVATQDLAEDEELFSIPRSSILTTETSTTPTDALQEIDDPWLSLIATIVLEYLKGTPSPWKPYFDILPENFDTLMFWTDDELKSLEGSAVVNKIGKEGADETFTEQLIPVIGKVIKKESLPGLSNEQLLALCHRMGSTIMSYAFDLENPAKNREDGWEEDSSDGEGEEGAVLPKGMVPMADMLNADADRNNAKLFYDDDKVVMKTLRTVKAGEELYNDFGSLPRADLLRRYGYVTENYAKYDVVEIPAELIREKAKDLFKLGEKDLDEKWEYLDEQGVLDDGYDVSRSGSEDGQFPEELGVLINLLATPKAEFDKWKKKEKLPKADLTSEAKKLLRTILVYRYAMYPEAGATIDSDDRRHQMAVQVIQGEKEVLQEAVAAVTDSTTGNKRSADTLEDEAAAIRQPAKK
ncbi:hypothetical protein M409DRAFT_70755 [Zasmidium cellare ATCC 36951]|uniref:Ribosomal lysine N-methyltransferase 4 n=1 Tax=Zasmidium cellare ATCC 36951 TaxID=1080233 RepID=A0A6A6BYT2_ZASCE|nr:uncharacterized protein M409DRAFT_70755 [Zasmidium cellare ATCC 36951]KAF2159865.1 hypothetical protein M409DRAFT_70755 [Zasmidium cellare ATCC 36951]